MHGVLKTELRFVGGWDTWEEILEQVQILEKCGSEFRYGVTRIVTNRKGWAGSIHGVSKTELRFVDRMDTQ